MSYNNLNFGSSNTRWVVLLPGVESEPVDFSTLSNWARLKQIKPDTLVAEQGKDVQYMARQIPGLFSDKEYIVALLFSIFLGTLGVDRFYVGHVGLGLAKLFTFGGCGIWWLIDVILIGTRSVTDSSGRQLV